MPRSVAIVFAEDYSSQLEKLAFHTPVWLIDTPENRTAAEEAWRTAVQSWIARAALVVVVPGQTKGLGWELGKIQAGGITPKLLLVFPPERSTSRATRLAALGGMLTDPRWLDAITTSQRTDLLAMFPTSRGDLVRVYSQKPRLADLEFAVELALYGMFCLATERASPGHRLAPPRSR